MQDGRTWLPAREQLRWISALLPSVALLLPAGYFLPLAFLSVVVWIVLDVDAATGCGAAAGFLALAAVLRVTVAGESPELAVRYAYLYLLVGLTVACANAVTERTRR